MPKEVKRTDQFVAEIKALRRQVSVLQGIERRCNQAEIALKACEERNQLLGDNAPLGIFTTDSQGTMTGITRKMLGLLHWPSTSDHDSMNLTGYTAMFSPKISDDIQRCINQKESLTTEHPHINPQGTSTHLRYYLSPITETDGTVSGAMGMVEDCTELKKTEAALRESEARYRQLFQTAPVALLERDASHLKAYLKQLRASGVSDFREYLEQNPQQIHHCWSLIKTVDYNQAFLELMGLAGSAELGSALDPTDSPDFMEMAREIILVVAEGNTANEREQMLSTASGKPKYVLGKSLVVSGNEESMKQVVIALVDISQRKKAEEALRESERRFRDQAFRDGLTGLYNQRYLYQSLAGCIERAQTTDTPISLIFMDLDHFKQVVDTYGHLNGSRAIREVACTINNCLQPPAYAVAYAGDEFVVILPGHDQTQALHKASEIRSRIKDTVYVLDQGIEVQLQASFGIATLPQHATELNGLIAAADQALFTIKTAGKDAIGQFQNH